MAQQNEDDKISDTDEEFSKILHGTLSFVNDDSIWADNKQSIGSAQESLAQTIPNVAALSRLTFEVTEAHIEKSGKSKFVTYGIVVGLKGASDHIPFCISRRYSNFEQLYKKLCKKYPLLTGQVDFPEKVLLGNFKSRTIANRSRRFEQLLQKLSEIDNVRLSAEFADFFYGDKLREVVGFLTQGNNNNALPALQELWLMVQKISGYQRPESLASLVALAVTSFVLEQFSLSQSYIEAALHLVDEQPRNHYTKPLLHFGIRLYWTLGKDKSDLERRLQQLEGSSLIKDLQASPAKLLHSLAVDDLSRSIVK